MTFENLLQLDIQPKYALEEQVRMVAAEFQRRYGHWPKTIYIHPSVATANDLTALGLTVETPRWIWRPDLMYVGGSEE